MQAYEPKEYVFSFGKNETTKFFLRASHVNMKPDDPEEKCCELMSFRKINDHFGIALLRVGVGVMMLSHGLPKVGMLVSGQGGFFPDPLGIGSTLSLFFAAFAECGCSLLLIIGLMTRAAAFVLAVNFGVIVFAVDAVNGWNNTELAIVYLLIFVTLILTGGGKLSVDDFLYRRFLRESPASICREED